MCYPLLAQSNTPAGWRGDAFSFDQEGEGHYTFTGPIDAAQLREQFASPASIWVYDDGSIKDSLNRADISQALPRRLFSLDLTGQVTTVFSLVVNYFRLW